AEGDALFQLPELTLVQPVCELGLPGEYQRQQLLGIRFDIAQETNLLEQFGREALRFIDDEYGRLASQPTLDQRCLRLAEEGGLRMRGARAQGEVIREEFDELVARQGRVG